MTPIKFSQHAREQMLERGASEAEVTEAIHAGESLSPKKMMG